MFFEVSFLLFAVDVTLLSFELSFVIVGLSLLILSVHVCTCCRFNNFLDFLKSQTSSQLLFFGWLAVFEPSNFLYYVPQLLSSVGKIYQTFFTESDQNLLQDFILLQSKCQMFIAVYHGLAAINNPELLISVGLFLLICWFKHIFHYGTQKAYDEAHLFIDRLGKDFGFRGFYQGIQKYLTYIAISLPQKKRIAY